MTVVFIFDFVRRQISKSLMRTVTKSNQITTYIDYLRNSEGKYIYVTDVELIYGDPFHPEHLPDGFWGSFETSLSDIDSELLNAFFDKTRSGLRKMNKCVNNAHRILQKAFCDWIGSIHIEPGESGYKFGDNCFIINFNYTDTLEKRFGVNDMQEYHIHGVAADADSIIFGHAAHPMGPMYTLRSLGDRFRWRTTMMRNNYREDGFVWFDDQISELADLLLNVQGLAYNG